MISCLSITGLLRSHTRSYRHLWKCFHRYFHHCDYCGGKTRQDFLGEHVVHHLGLAPLIWEQVRKYSSWGLQLLQNLFWGFQSLKAMRYNKYIRTRNVRVAYNFTGTQWRVGSWWPPEKLQRYTTDHCLLIVAVVIWLNNCRFDVKPYSINQSINQI